MKKEIQIFARTVRKVRGDRGINWAAKSARMPVGSFQRIEKGATPSLHNFVKLKRFVEQNGTKQDAALVAKVTQ